MNANPSLLSPHPFQPQLKTSGEHSSHPPRGTNALQVRSNSLAGSLLIGRSMTAIVPPPFIPRALEPEVPMRKTMVTPPQCPRQDQDQSGVPRLAALPTHPQPTLGRVIGSQFFHLQEREVFSAPTFFRIQIDVDHPGDPRSAGGPYIPPQSIILPRREVPPPPQPVHSTSTSWGMSTSPQSPHTPSSTHRRVQPPSQPSTSMQSNLRTTSTSPVSIVREQRDTRKFPERRNRLQHPCPPHKPKHSSPSGSMINGDTQQRCTYFPDFQQKRAQKVPGREGS